MEYFGKEITGKQFNELYSNVALYKFTNKEENHCKYQYQDGVNINTNPFNINNGEYSYDGLYFTTEKDMFKWLHPHEYVRSVTIPDNARICIYQNKVKSNILVLGPRIRIIDSTLLITEEVQKIAIQSNIYNFRYIKNPSYELQVLVVTIYPFFISKYDNPSEEIQTIVIRKNSALIQHIKNPSEEIQMLAVQDRVENIRHIENLCEKAQMLSVQKNINSISYIKNPSIEVQRYVVEKCGDCLKYINNPNEEIQKLAVQNDACSIQYITNPCLTIQLMAVRKNGQAIRYILNPCKSVILEAILQNVYAIQHVQVLDVDMLKLATECMQSIN